MYGLQRVWSRNEPNYFFLSLKISKSLKSGVLWGSRKTLFRRVMFEERGHDNHFREIGQKYPISKGIYRENHKNDYFFFVTLF